MAARIWSSALIIGTNEDVFGGGVLSTRSAWAIWTASFVVRVRAGWKLLLPSGSLFCYQLVMAKSTVSDNRKKRIGRPPVGATLVVVRLPPLDLAALDRWIARQPEPMTRPEALRAMMATVLEIGLASGRKK